MPLTAAELERYSPAHRATLTARQLVVHGTDDADVPVEMSDAYVASRRDAGDAIDYLREEGIGHMDVIDPASATWHKVVRWLES